MKIAGIIVEYNPLHNGHIHHINETRRLSKCDVLVVVMSGNFVQRGDLSSINKFIKTDIALNHGADIVVELPFAYVNQSADLFSYGAISILNQFNVSEIYFGCEDADMVLLNKCVSSIKENDALIRSFIKKGYSYKAAIAKVVNNDFITKSNNILGITYTNAINKINNAISLIPIQRIKSDYNELIPSNDIIASATSIRNLIKNKKEFKSFLPNELHSLESINSIYDLEKELIYKIKSMSLSELNSIHHVDEGLNHLLFNSIKDCYSYDELIKKLVSKRYSLSRINRMLISILLNVTKDEINELDLYNTVPSIRILGFNSKGSTLLKEIKDDVFLITKVVEGISKMLDLELKGSKIYSIVEKKVWVKEFMKPIIKEK